MATGTFTSKDTYAGRMQDILSQNRYTYAENNPMGHSDTSGHAVKSGMGAAITRAFQNTSFGRGKKARAATQAAVAAYANEQRSKDLTVRTNLLNDVTRAQNNAQWTDRFLRAGMGMGILSGAANTVIIDPYVSQVALAIERAKCQVYKSCYNPIQEAIKDKDMTRITKGIWLVVDGADKGIGAALYTALSIKLLASGVGAPAATFTIPSATALYISSGADITQGIQEISLGLKGDSLTDTQHAIIDTCYDGDEFKYQLHTNLLTLAVMGYNVVKTPQKLLIKNGDDLAETIAKQSDELLEGGLNSKYLEQLNGFSENKINHIINGSKGSNHGWENLVPDKNWDDIKTIIGEVMETGVEGPYKTVYSKKAIINGFEVEVTYTKLSDGTIKISDAWINQ